MTVPDLRAGALEALRIPGPSAKVDAVRALVLGSLAPDCAVELSEGPGIPGRPVRPNLVRPAQLPRRPVTTTEGRGALLHSIAHIEFNAINLALDAIWRFSGLPATFYTDWLQVASEEAQHFTLIEARLASIGVSYGDHDAHNGLWEMAEKTRGDALARMALVPRTLEARGLDASPPIRAKLDAAGDRESAAVLDVILRDEIGHVAIGNRWFRFLCDQRGLDIHRAYAEIARTHGAPRLRGPFNIAARRAAGFDESELNALDP